MHHVVDQTTLLVLKFLTHKKFHNHEKKFFGEFSHLCFFQHKKLLRLNITSNKALIVKQDILDMSRKKSNAI